MTDVMYPSVLRLGSGAIKVAAVGDSLTYGYGLENRVVDAYPSILLEKLGSHYQMENFGLAGRSLQSTSDYPYLQEENGQLSLASDPDIVLIMIGSNDSRAPYWNKERFTAEYRQFVQGYQNLESQPDVMVIVPPFVPTTRFGLNNDIIKEELQTIIPEIAQELQCTCINLYPITEGHLEYYSDGLHLNPLGNRVIAEEIYSHFIR